MEHSEMLQGSEQTTFTIILRLSWLTAIGQRSQVFEVKITGKPCKQVRSKQTFLAFYLEGYWSSILGLSKHLNKSDWIYSSREVSHQSTCFSWGTWNAVKN